MNISALLLPMLLISTTAMAEEPAATTESSKTKLPVLIKRNINCADIGIDVKKMTDWKVERKAAESTDTEKRLSYGINKNEFVYSTVRFPTTIPEDSFIEIKAKAEMVWKSRANKTRQNTESSQTFYGADSKPVAIDFRHQEFFKIEKVEIISVRCNRFVVDIKKAEEFCGEMFGKPAETTTEPTATPAAIDASAAPLTTESKTTAQPQPKPKSPSAADPLMPPELPERP